MNPDEDICALVYNKSQFDFPDDDDYYLTDEGWETLCTEFDEQPWRMLWEFLFFGVLEYARPKNEGITETSSVSDNRPNSSCI